MASLAVALTLTPALALLFFGKGVRSPKEPLVQTWLKSVYRRWLGFLADWPRTVIALVVGICAAAITKLPFFGGEFLPQFREGHFVLQVSTAPGTSLPEMLRIGQSISEALLRHKNIATVEQQAGRAEQGEDPWGPHRCEFHVDLKPLSGEEAKTMAGEIRQILARFPGIQSTVLTFLGDRIGETITGETAPVVISLFGDDLEVLDAKAREVVKVLQKVRGAADVSVKSPPGAPCLAIRLRPQRLAQFGVRPVEVLNAIQTAYQGTMVAQTFQGNRVSEVTVILEEPARRDLESVGDLQLRSAQGLRVPLRECPSAISCKSAISASRPSSPTLAIVRLSCALRTGRSLRINAAPSAVR